MGWWTDTDSLMNRKCFILELMNDIKNPGSESMHIHNKNVYYEGLRMCHWNLGLKKAIP